ncbi:Integrin alpha-PS2 [Armadillidium vulgare]|nr:Integrin alpha-PS2 [Armadillidium vulgare]
MLLMSSSLVKKDMLNVSIGVINEGEDAFEATVLISEPKGLLFNKFEPRENTSCSTRNIGGNTFIKCDIGNPLPKDQKVNFHVFFQQSGELEKPEFEFLVTANSTNAEANTYADNEARKVVEAKVEAKLTLFGSSDPDSIIYNTSLYQIPVRHHESHYGPSVVHKYGLLSEGPSDIEHAEIVILWPSRTLSEKHLLYLMEQPVTVGKIKCDPLPYINPLNLNTISQEERRSILGLTSLEGTYQASTEKETSSRFHQSSSISSNTGKISSGSKSSISSSSSSSSSSSISSSTSEGRKSSTPTQRGGSSYYYSQRSGSAGGRHGSSYRTREERSRTAAHYPSSSFQGGSRGGGYSTSTSVHENQRGNDQYSSSSSPSSFDGTYREGSYFSSGHRGSESGYSASAAGSQRGPILPSSGRDGKFTSTLFNVHGGESTGGERTSSSSASESGFSSQSEADRRYGSASSGHYSGGRGSDASTSQSHGGGYSGHRGSESTGGERTSSSSASESGFSSQSEADRRYGSASSGHYSGGRGSDASTSQSHGGGYSSSTSYSSPEEKSRSGHASVRKEHHYYSSSDGLGSEHRSHSGSKDDGRQYSSSYYVEHSPDVSSSSSFSHRSSSKSSSSSSLPDQYYRQNEIDSRRKRETATEDEWDNLLRECGATRCTRIHCRTERLTANDDVYIYIRSRLWVDTLNEFKFPVDDVTVSTRMVARVHVEPHEIASESSNIYTKNVITPIRSAKSLAEAPPVPWWVILLAYLLRGILILLLIILILWKLGFFKRQRAKSTKS